MCILAPIDTCTRLTVQFLQISKLDYQFPLVVVVVVLIFVVVFLFFWGGGVGVGGGGVQSCTPDLQDKMQDLQLVCKTRAIFTVLVHDVFNFFYVVTVVNSNKLVN